MSFGDRKSMNKYNLQFFKRSTPQELMELLNSFDFEYDLLSIAPTGLNHIAWIHSVRKVVKKNNVKQPEIKEEGLATEKNTLKKVKNKKER